jgi:RHS repeat-associated protein
MKKRRLALAFVVVAAAVVPGADSQAQSVSYDPCTGGVVVSWGSGDGSSSSGGGVDYGPGGSTGGGGEQCDPFCDPCDPSCPSCDVCSAGFSATSQPLTTFELPAPGTCDPLGDGTPIGTPPQGGSSSPGKISPDHPAPLYKPGAPLIPNQSLPPDDAELSKIMSLDTSTDSIYRRADYPGPLASDKTDPVRDGELVVQRVDVDLPSAGIPFRFVRTYRSRVSHVGVLGFGWDHNYNRRLIATNGCGDVELLTGDSGRIRFKLGAKSVGVSADGQYHYAYLPPDGVPLRLEGIFSPTDSASKRWRLDDGHGYVQEFDSNGLLTSISDKAGNSLQLQWEEIPRSARDTLANPAWNHPHDARFIDHDLDWRIRSVVDSTIPGRTVYLNYLAVTAQGYHLPNNLFLTCVSLEKDDCSHALVSYDLTGDGDADKVGDLLSCTRANGTGESYDYHRDFATVSQYAPDDAADSFCSNACGPSTDCSISALCSSSPPTCVHQLDALTQQYPDVDLNRLCLESILDEFGCARQQEGTTFPDVDDPQCASFAPDLNCAATCIQQLKPHWKQLPGTVEPDQYTHRPVVHACNAKYSTLCKNPTEDEAIAGYCRNRCYAAQLCGISNTSADVCRSVNWSTIPFCAAGDCYQTCRARYQPKDGQGNPIHVYGRPEDLNHNLIAIHDLQTKKLIQANNFATDPTQPSFDKVTGQQLGEALLDPNAYTSIQFYYFDLARALTAPVHNLGAITQTFAAAPAVPGAVTATAHAAATSFLTTAPPPDQTSLPEKLTLIWGNVGWSADAFIDKPPAFTAVDICPNYCVEKAPALTASVPSGPVHAVYHPVHLTAATASTTQPAATTPVTPAANLLTRPIAPVALPPVATATLRPVSRASFTIPAATSVQSKTVPVPTDSQLTTTRPPVSIGNLPTDMVVPGPKEVCVRWNYQSPNTSAGSSGPQLPTDAVVVLDLRGTTRTAYYDKHGRLLRDVNHHHLDHGPKEVTDYNYDEKSGGVRGVLYPNGRRTCNQFDAAAHIVQSSELPAPGAVGVTSPIVTLFSYAGDFVKNVTADPTSPVPFFTHFERDFAGRVLSKRVRVDATRYETTGYSYDGATMYPGTITNVDGSVTTQDAGGGLVLGKPGTIGSATGPTHVVHDATGPEPIATSALYDSLGRLASVARPGHNLGSFVSRDTDGRILASGYTGPNGAAVRTVYSHVDTSFPFIEEAVGTTETTTTGRDTLGHLRWRVEVGKDGSRRSTCWNFGADGRLEAVLRPAGNLVEYLYDEADRLRTVKEGYPVTLPDWAQACVAELSAQSLPVPTRSTEPADEQTTQTLDYDAAGNLHRIADGSGVGMTFTPDGFGRVIDTVDDDGNHLRRGYDTRGRVAWEAVLGPNAPPYSKPTQLDPAVPLESMVEYSYDNLDRVVRADRWHFVGTAWVNAAKHYLTTTVDYDDANARTLTTVDGHPPLVTEFDGLGRVRKETLPNGNITTQTHGEGGPFGERVSWTLTGPDGQLRSGIDYYDDYGHLRRANDDAGVSVMEADYDDLGLLRNQFKGTQVSQFDYDSFSRLISLVEGTGASARQVLYGWDGNDRLSSVKDADQATTAYFYNGRDLVSHGQHPGNALSVRHYVAGSTRLNDDTNQWGTTRGYLYYPSGRLQSEHFTNGALAFGGGIDRSYSYTASGRIGSATVSGNGGNPTNNLAVTLAYDSLGNRILDDMPLSPFSVENIWDPAAGPAQTTLRLRGAPSRSPSITRHFDDVGRLADVSVAGRLVATLNHESAAGRVVFGGGAISAVPTFDHRGRLVAEDVKLNGQAIASIHDAIGVDGVARERQRTFGSQVLTDFYRLDDGGRVVGENVGVAGVTPLGEPAADVNDQTFGGYFDDPSVRGNSFRNYDLDGAADWLSVTDQTGSHASTFTAATDLHQYQTDAEGRTWTYVAGTVAGVGNDSYKFDVLGQLFEATVGGRTIQFGYDALGRRVLEHDLTAGTTTNLVWDGAEPIAWGPGSALASYTVRIGGDGLDEHLAIVQGFGSGSMYYLHGGPDGSIAAATTDQGLAEAYTYSAFGETRVYDGNGTALAASAIGNRYLFQGQLYDAALGAYSMRAREYLPSAGRFLSADPTGIAGGENLYAFVLGRPLALRDPFGLSSMDFSFAGPGSFGGSGAFQSSFQNLSPEQIAIALRSPNLSDAQIGQLRRIISPEQRLGLTVTDTLDSRFHPVNRALQGYTPEATAMLGTGSAMVGGAVAAPFLIPAAISLAGQGGAAALSTGYVNPTTVTVLGYEVAAGFTGAPSISSVWRLPPSPRGFAIGAMLGENLPKSFPTIDRVAGSAPIAEEIASIKSMDLTAKTYQEGSRVFSRLKSYLNDLASYSSASLKGIQVTAGPDTVRILDLAIERGVATPGQLIQIGLAIEYGAKLGIQMFLHGVE